MNKKEAHDIIEKTFKYAYSEKAFRNFINQIFDVRNDTYQELTENAASGQIIKESFRDHIASSKRLAKLTDKTGKKIDIIAVKVKNSKKLDYARTMQRNFIAHHLDTRSKDAALVAFYADDCADWRFSMVTLDYVYDAEKNKIKEQLPPAKRYSFLVGESEKTHTAQMQFVSVLTQVYPVTLDDLQKAFDIEKVTDEFFAEYKKLYLSLRDALNHHLTLDIKTKTEFEVKNIKSDDFAKRLLGQIVFLYFLQKKGWLGVAKDAQWGTGSKIFLQDLFKQYPQKNYFNDILEPLFYEALATERSNHFYNALNCKIPFLNGGLFEPIRDYDWVNTDILLDNQIFQKIFETFDLYNFTVREDEPLDKEVAVDPEMLGKVFENLIPENERKGSGTFYTPREIVHYMCLESLINYLDTSLNYTKKPIETTRQQTLIPDLVKKDLLTQYQDVYHPIISREILEDFIHKAGSSNENDETAHNKRENNPNYKGNYEHKLHPDIIKHIQKIDDALANIKICDPAIGSGAFPVGILSEIVRLRYALNPYLTNTNRTLYHLKRHTIQESIYGVDIESSAVDIARLRLWLSLVVDEDNFDRIEPLPNLDYKIVVGNSLLGFPYDVSRRNDELRKLKPLKEEFIKAHSPEHKKQLREQINHIIQSEYDNSCEKSLGYKVDFDFRWSFFEVFDAKGGFDVVIGNPPYVVSSDKLLRKKYAESIYGRPNLYGFFIHCAIQTLINQTGIITFINPRTLLTDSYFSALRRLILKYSNIHLLMDIIDRKNVFKNVLQSCIVNMFTAKNLSKQTRIKIIATKNDIFNNDIIIIPQKELIFGQDDSIFLVAKNKAIYNIFTKLPQKTFSDVGIKFVTGKVQWDIYKNVLSDKKEFSYSTRLIWAENIQRYRFFNARLRKGKEYINKPLDIPKISCKTIIVQRTTAVEQAFRIIAHIIDAQQLEHDIICENHTSFIEKHDSIYSLELILGLLNSKFMDFIFRHINSNTQVSAGELNSLPFPLENKEKFQELEALVKRVIALYSPIHQEEENQEAILLQKKVDKIVYELYGLSDDEVRIIEGV